MITDYFCELFTEALPYAPTFEQEQLIVSLSEFILSEERRNLFLLNGYAGTGKSSLIGGLVKVLTQLERKTILLAPTGRAAKVFSTYADQNALTVHKKIYRQQSFSPDMAGFLIGDNLHKNTLFIVDEASMVSNSSSESIAYGSGRLLDDLIQYVYAGEGCRLLLLGDTAQLPPVGQPESPALERNRLEGYGLDVTFFQLHEVVRQGRESGVLFNATRIREQMNEIPLSFPQIRFGGFSDMENLSGEELEERLSSCYNRDGADETILITRSNKRANLFNQGIRNRILYREEELSSGDVLLIARNNYFWGKDEKELDFIANGDMVNVVKVRHTQDIYGLRFADVLLHFPDYNIELEAKVILDTLTTETPSLSREANQQLYSLILEDYYDIRSKRDKLKRLKEDPFFNALQIKYGYAVTCYKAQGGQWKNVFVDMGYLRLEQPELDFYRWLYTSITRTTDHLYFLNLGEKLVEPANHLATESDS